MIGSARTVRAPSTGRASVSPLVSVSGLGRSFGPNEVVRRLDLEVSAGERVALIGPNGSGKTTVLRCIAGTLTPSRGSVAVDGRAPIEAGTRRSIGFSLSQERSFYMRLSGRANLLFFARVRGSSRREAAEIVDALSKELELADILAERADRCSTGMIQQLGFARALLGEPSLLLLDEPTRSLDKHAVERVWAAVARRPECAVVIATHHEEDIERCTSRVELPT